MRKILLISVLGCSILLWGCGKSNSVNSLSYENVDLLNQEAGADYNNGQYAEALTKYAEALAINPVNMDTQLGIASCQIKLKNYPMAAVNLSAAVKVDPSLEEIYDLYVKLSEVSGEISYARTAVSLAEKYQNESFLSRVPSPPEMSIPEGNYNEKLELAITAEEGSDIYVSEYDGSSRSLYQYNNPLVLTTGTIQIETYCMRDGIPSEVVSAEYTCSYEPSQVLFDDPVVEQCVRKELGISDAPVMDLDCEKLERLDLDLYSPNSEISVHKLDDLRLFPNLTSLHISRQMGITDFSPLFCCRKLSSLTLSYCGISDISFVTSMNSLRDLRIADNQVTDISFLAEMPDLSYLYINNNPIVDINVIKDMDLTGLSVNTWQIPDTAFLQNFKNLKSLYLYDCGAFDVSSLGMLTHLTRLYLYDLSDYSQLSSLKELYNLEYLYLRGENHTDPPKELIQDLQRSLPNCEIRY